MSRWNEAARRFVEKYQKARGLTPDGMAGVKTNADLDAWIAENRTEPESKHAPVVVPGEKLLWCPFAETGYARSRTRGTYARGYPRGAIVHFTAGRRSGLLQGLTFQVSQGFTYFLIDAHGNIGQNFPLDSWGYHAGRSSWPGLSGNVSDELVGIEIQAAGMLEKHGDEYRAWFGEVIPAKEVRLAQAVDNKVAGPYQMFTEEQEAALIKLVLWLHRNNSEVFDLNLVLGHDEVSPGRKNDPGGALSMTMPAFREMLLKAQ